LNIEVYCNSTKTGFINRIEKRFSEPITIKSTDELENFKQVQDNVVFIIGEPVSEIELPYSVISNLWSFVENGGMLFGESINCMGFPTSRLFGFKQDYPTVRRTTEKLRITNKLLESHADYLLEWSGFYQKGFAVSDNLWLTVGSFQETHQVNSLISSETPALISHSLGKGQIIYSAFSFIGADDQIPLRPQWLWSLVLRSLRIYETIPLSEFHKESLSIGNRSPEEAIKSSERWFVESGILPKSDGTGGIYENIHSVTAEVTKDFRPDCHAHTSLMSYLFYKYTGVKSWADRSSNLMSYLFNEGYQDLNESSPTYGFWKWYKSPDKHPDQIFTDDNSWVCFVLLYLYQETGIEEYRKRGLLTANALLETQHDNGLRPEVLRRKKLFEVGRREGSLQEKVSMNPHFESIAHAAFIQAYNVTNEEKYLDTAYRGTKYLLNNKKDMKFMYSRTSGYTRLLFVLAQLVHHYNETELAEALDETIDYLKSYQHISGGVEEADNPDPTRFGKEDTGVYRFNGEGIADFLYTNNFLLINLWEAWKATGNEKVYQFYCELRDFVSRAQIKSSIPKYNGGWMRAYDLNHEEYFGNNGDTGWGPYCIESGWTNALTTVGLLLGEMDDSLFDSDTFIKQSLQK